MKRWHVVAIVTVVSLLAIQACFGDYVQLQTAADADAFRRIVGTNAGRATAAAVADLVFAAAYTTLGVMGYRSLGLRVASRAGGLGTLSRVGLIAVVVGGVSDELENLLVIANVARRDTIDDDAINLMQIPGTIKWLAIAAMLMLAVLLLLKRTAHVQRKDNGEDQQ